MRALLLACLAALVLSACDLGVPEAPPAIGTFTIAAVLKSNTCGAGGFPADNSFEKTAVVGGYANERASFKWTDQSATATGSASSTGRYQFSSTQSVPSRTTDPVTGQPYCTFAQTTQLTFTIAPVPVRPPDGGIGDAGGTDSGIGDAGTSGDGGTTGSYVLSGTYTEDVVPTSGTGCEAFRAANGGSFDNLPCRVEYAIDGTAPR